MRRWRVTGIGLLATLLVAAGSGSAAWTVADRAGSTSAAEDAEAPGAPVLHPAVSGSGAVFLSWDPPSSDGGSTITGYRVYRDGPGEEDPLLATLGVVTEHTDPTALNGIAYQYWVTALNAVGEGPPSNLVGATPATLPDAPDLISATGGDGEVALTWGTPGSDGGAPITAFKVYRGAGEDPKTLLETVGAVHAFTDTTVTNGVDYVYQVSAVNAVGEGPLSNELALLPLGPPDAPTLDSATPGNGSVALAWSPPAVNGGAAIEGYKVYRGTTSGGETLLATLGDVTVYTDTGAENGTTYYYEVSAVSSLGEGLRSNELSATPATVPDAPTLESATPGNATVTLAWSAPASDGGAAITGYKVYRGTSPGSGTVVATLGVVTGYSDPGLSNGTTYVYRVAALNSVGEGAQSGELSATPRTVPDAPALNPASAGDATVTLTWVAPFDGGSPITAYNVYRGTTSGGKTLLTTVGAVTTYTDTAVVNGTTYHYEVSAVNDVGEGAHSAERMALPRTVPGAPTLTSAVGAVGRVTLTWTAPTVDGGATVTSYKAYRSANGVESEVATVSGVLTVDDTGGVKGTAYAYSVRAVNVVGEGARSNEITATSTGVPFAPTLANAVGSDGAVVLQWTAPPSSGSPVTGYNVYRGLLTGPLSLLVELGTVTGYVDTSVVNGTTYRYRVNAVNALGLGADSNTLSALPAAVPTAPTLDSATAAIGKVTLEWSPPVSNGGAPVTGYRVYRGTSSGGETLLTTIGNVTVYDDESVAAGTTYYYKVAALNSTGQSALSNERSATPPTVPGAPTLDSATPQGSTIALAWSPPASNGGLAVTGYKVYRGTSSGTGSLVASLGVVTGYTDPAVIGGTTYFYKVAAVNAVGEGTRSNERSATVPTDPGAPTFTAAVASNRSIALGWSPPASTGGASITAYKVYRAGPAAGETLLATTGSVTEYTDSSVQNGVLYTYRVSAVNSVGEGPKSTDRTAIASAVTFGRPWWWNGPCDAVSWNAAAALLGWAGAGAHELGASFLGVPVCGPRPADDDAPTVLWGRPGQGVPAWESSELAYRFMAQVSGVRPYAATPENVVRSYTTAYGGGLEYVENDTAGSAPLPGDVISFDHPIGSGHVAVVAASSVDASGNGSITLVTQNDTANGWRTVLVTGWTLRNFGQNIPYGWLHDPTPPGGGPPEGRNDTVIPTELGPRPDVPAPPPTSNPQRPPRP